jgi:hypothetical protein
VSKVEKVTAGVIAVFTVVAVAASCGRMRECEAAGGTWQRGICFAPGVVIP